MVHSWFCSVKAHKAELFNVLLSSCVKKKKHLEDIDQKDNVNNCFFVSLLLYCVN